MNGYLNNFVAASNATASAALGQLALAIPRCRTEQFSRAVLPAAGRLSKFRPSGVLSGSTLSSFKSVMNLCLLMVSLFLYLYFIILLLLYSLIAWYRGSEAVLVY